MNIKLTADSTCDLSSELLERYDITLLPLYVILNGKTYRDGVDIHSEDVFSHVDAGGKLCSTSAVNVEDYRRCFEQLSAQCDAVIHVTIGSSFSSCYQNASIAASAFENVYVVDSMSLSSGQGYLVAEAAKKAHENLSAVEICSYLHEIRGRVKTSFILDRLDYMQKGGRCSSATALGANLLKIKPCIELKNGVMGVADKFRGDFVKCIEKYVKEQLKDRKDLKSDLIFITHSACSEIEVEAARAAVLKYADFSEIHIVKTGCTVSCHCGPHTLGIIYMTR